MFLGELLTVNTVLTAGNLVTILWLLYALELITVETLLITTEALFYQFKIWQSVNTVIYGEQFIVNKIL